MAFLHVWCIRSYSPVYHSQSTDLVWVCHHPNYCSRDLEWMADVQGDVLKEGDAGVVEGSRPVAAEVEAFLPLLQALAHRLESRCPFLRHPFEPPKQPRNEKNGPHTVAISVEDKRSRPPKCHRERHTIAKQPPHKQWEYVTYIRLVYDNK